MAVTTRRSNARAHPGRVVLDNQRTRRTKEQVQEAKAHAKEVKDKEESRRRALPGRIAQLEDEIETEEQARREHSMRPDLRGVQPSDRRTSPQSPGDNSQLINASDDEYELRGDACDDVPVLPQPRADDPRAHWLSRSGFESESPPPEMSPAPEMNADEENLHMTPPNTPNLYTGSHADSGVENCSDEDDEEWENIDPRLRPPVKQRHGKDSEKRASLRAEVNALRGVHRDSSWTLQGKRPMPPVPDNTANPKRLKRSNAIGGFDPRWKENVKHVVPRPRHRQGTMLALNQGDNGNNGNGDGGLPGEFDGDEPDDLLIHVERSKDSVPATYRTSRVSPGNPRVELERAATGTSVATSRNTEEMGIRLRVQPLRRSNSDSTNTGRTAAPAESTSSTADKMSNLNTSCDTGDIIRKPKRRVRATNAHKSDKTRYTVSDLPLPRGGKHLQIWKKAFIPSLFAWAGAHEDPFVVNGELPDVVTDIWSRVFPGVTLEEDSIVNVVKVSEDALNNWRSQFGKDGYCLVRELMESRPAQEDCEAFVSDELDDLRYIYKHPNRKSSRGAFRSALISKVYSPHLRRLSSVTNQNGYQIGALALAAAAVERGLTLFKTGKDIKAERGHVPRKRDTQASDNICAIGFTEPLWGSTTRGLVKATMKLTKENWEMITQECEPYLPRRAPADIQSNEDHLDGGHGVSGLHASIQVDW